MFRSGSFIIKLTRLVATSRKRHHRNKSNFKSFLSSKMIVENCHPGTLQH